MSQKLPLWVSKKYVSADVIKFVGHENGAHLLYLECGHVVYISDELFLETQPNIGDYYAVTGLDQATIWPKDEFERDHTRAGVQYGK